MAMDDVICRLALLPDPSGTNKDAAVLLERLCWELAEMREQASVWSRAISEWSGDRSEAMNGAEQRGQ